MSLVTFELHSPSRCKSPLCAKVRSFEYLRCLGGGLIDEEMQSAQAADNPEIHIKRIKCVNFDIFRPFQPSGFVKNSGRCLKQLGFAGFVGSCHMFLTTVQLVLWAQRF